MSAKLFSMVIALMFIAVAVQAQQYVTDGLIAFWTLDDADINDDTVSDVSGSGNDATIMGALASVPGVIGEALQFDRGANYVEIPDMGEMEQNSLECWAYVADLSHQYQGIISTYGWTAGKVHFKFQDGQIQVDKNGVGKVQLNAEAETWYHIIYTQGIDDGIKLYVDGVLVDELAGAGAVPENWHERRIGSEHDENRYLDGMIDEVRVYNRILSADEIVQNFSVTSNDTTAVEPDSKLATTWSSIKISR